VRRKSERERNTEKL